MEVEAYRQAQATMVMAVENVKSLLVLWKLLSHLAFVNRKSTQALHPNMTPSFIISHSQTALFVVSFFFFFVFFFFHPYVESA